MYQYDDVTAAASLPVPSALGTVGYFTDGSSGGGVQPTRLRSDFMNMLMMEMLNVVTAAGLTPSKNTYTQVLTAIQLMIQQETGNYALDTGSANTYLVAFNPAITVLTNGMVLRFKALNANSGASTIAVNAIAAKSIVRDDGAGTALAAGDIPANGIIEIVYDLPNTRFVLTSVNQNLSTIQIQQQTGNYAAAGGTANAITATMSPALGAHVIGMPIRIKILSTNTAAVTFNPGPGAIAVRDYEGAALAGGELRAGEIATLIYDGTVYQCDQRPTGVLIKREVFTASGTWTKDGRARRVVAKVQAPGAGGGGVDTGGNYGGAAGGSAGSYAEIELVASSLAATVAVTVGTGGAGGSATGPANGSNGSAASSFGAHLSCAAGLGGTAMANGTSTSVVAGGASPALPGTGDVKIVGQAGGVGARENWSASAFGAMAGDGGNSFMGAGGKAPRSTTTALAGVAGTGYGSGGSGACVNSANGAAGGAGAPGIVIVESYS